MSKVEVSATLEYFFDNETAVISFKHPSAGWCELEMQTSELPAGVDSKDEMTLIIEDEPSREEIYTIKGDSLIKSPKSIDNSPSLPDDLEDPEKMADYERRMTNYFTGRLGGSGRSSNGMDGMSL